MEVMRRDVRHVSSMGIQGFDWIIPHYVGHDAKTESPMLLAEAILPRFQVSTEY